MTLFLFLICGCLLHGRAQRKINIKGYIKDMASGEDLIGATVSIEMLETGTTTNIYGYYSLSLPPGYHALNIQYVGYEQLELTARFERDTTLDLELSPYPVTLQEVVVSAKSREDRLNSLQMGVHKMSPKEIEVLPVLFGEKDILKTLQLLPGIQATNEGNSGFYVRGGNLDQNLVLLDEATVYNPSHLLGLFSIFNPDAVKDVHLVKGDLPAQYGGRISSVLDTRMKEGNTKKFSGAGSLGLISSKLTLEAPIVKEKSSFMVSGRRTYLDLFLRASQDDDLRNTQLYFYDLNAKANYQWNNKDRIFLSGYIGRDRFGFGDDFGFDWGNAMATLRWNHLFSDRLFSNTSLIYSDYDYQVTINDGDDDIEIRSAIEDLHLKQDFDYFFDGHNTLKFGTDLIHHTFVPGEITSEEGGQVDDTKVEDRYALEGAFYLSNEQKINHRLSLRYGLRYSWFNVFGPGTYKRYDRNGDVVDEREYDRGESVQYYDGLEPRLGFNYLVNAKSSIKGSFSRANQYVHLLSNSTTATPTDIWVPSSLSIKPQTGAQASLGYYRELGPGKYEFSTEVYYKNMDHVIDYKNGADLFVNEDLEAALLFGEGRAYGVEFLLEKQQGRLTGWVSYTLSRSERIFEEINDGNPFPARQDRTHDISLVGSYQLSPKLSISMSWVYFTGNAVTFPSGKYQIEDRTVSYYSERNGYRMPDYHRLDLALGWTAKKTARFESYWYFSLYNVYGRENAYTIDFQEDLGNPGTMEAVRLALFKFVPSVSYTVKF